jgi:REP element-mobilizing transposase RayT
MPHHAFQLYAHITWHTWRRVPCVTALVARDIGAAILDAGRRTGAESIAFCALSDHVHALVSFKPDTRLSDFVRLAKNISALVANRRVPGAVKWARGFYAATIHRQDLARVAGYIHRQYERHPDRIPIEPKTPLSC